MRLVSNDFSFTHHTPSELKSSFTICAVFGKLLRVFLFAYIACGCDKVYVDKVYVIKFAC